MVKFKRPHSLPVLLGVFLLWESYAWAGDGIISRQPDPSGSFCHLRCPAIREDTLFSTQPELKDSSEGDIIDAYGPCDFDPLGRDSIVQQQRNYRLRRGR
jgi:hypothetical protein